MKAIEGFQSEIEDPEYRLQLLQDVQPDLLTISAKLISATTLSATMKGKRRISEKKSILLEVVAEIRRISEFLGEEALIEVALNMKTIYELELKTWRQGSRSWKILKLT